MDTSQITTASDFRDFVRSVVLESAKTYHGTLEEYLRALWAIIQEQRNAQPSFALFAGDLTAALTKEPLLFDEGWLSHKSPPDLVYGRNPLRVKNGYNCLQHMILYQIADLHRMARVGTINHPYRYDGIDSPTGYNWYNFDPWSFLNRASQGLEDNEIKKASNWAVLALFLWLGQIYE